MKNKHNADRHSPLSSSASATGFLTTRGDFLPVVVAAGSSPAPAAFFFRTTFFLTTFLAPPPSSSPAAIGAAAFLRRTTLVLDVRASCSSASSAGALTLSLLRPE